MCVARGSLIAVVFPGVQVVCFTSVSVLGSLPTLAHSLEGLQSKGEADPGRAWCTWCWFCVTGCSGVDLLASIALSSSPNQVCLGLVFCFSVFVMFGSKPTIFTAWFFPAMLWCLGGASICVVPRRYVLLH